MLRSVVTLFLCLAALPIWCAAAWADDKPTFFADPATGCRLGSFHPESGMVPHWSGACTGGFAEGPGTAEWQINGQFNSRNEGTYHAGLREGRVINVNADGDRVEGEFHGGRLNGRCVEVFADGGRFDGQCVNDERNGLGKQTFASGNRYEGDYRNGEISGRGVYTWTSGQRYEGDFADGQRNGRGRETYAGGAHYEGDWVDGDYEGQGMYTFDDGQVYEGEWSNDLPNGRGVLHGTTHGLLGSGQHDFAGTWVNGCFAQDPYTASLFKSAAECGFN
jgi:hypothetical protein